MSSIRREATQPQPRPARRVTLRYQDGVWTFVRSKKTPPTILPASESLTDPSAYTKSGAWYEVADARGRLVYRRLIYDLYGQIGEGFEKGRPVVWITKPRDLVISLLVPNLPDAGRLSLFSSPPLSLGPREKNMSGAKRVAAFALPADETEVKK